MDLLFDTLCKFFQNDGWRYAQAHEAPVLQLRFEGEHGRWDCYAHARSAEQQVAFYSVCAINAPEDRRGVVAEFLTRANYGLIPGSFEMDWDTGEIRLKSALEVDDTLPSPDLLKRLVYTNVALMDAYLPGLLSVIYGQVAPREAVAAIEGE